MKAKIDHKEFPQFRYDDDNWEEIKFESLKGKILVAYQKEEDFILFQDSDGDLYVMMHLQDCCESVIVEDVCGELDWLLNTPILLAEERSNEGKNDDEDHHTWTFYELATINGAITIRWYGTSNGYYSEAVEFFKQK